MKILLVMTSDIALAYIVIVKLTINLNEVKNKNLASNDK
jgi:hypothetical protein